ncbi:MAG: class F sortase [Candidatus Dormibacteraeota bacterium]|nr:class F sortase [Candidatus Dormibacteraeota bacterium]
MEYEDWFWEVDGGSLGADGLDPDAEGWSVAPRPAAETVAAGGTTLRSDGRSWGPIDAGSRPAAAPAAFPPVATGGGVWLTTLRRTRVGLVVAIVLMAMLGYVMLQVLAPKTRPGYSSASAVVDSGADVALMKAAVLNVAPVHIENSGPRPPGRLIIRSIGVDAQVIAVGVDRDGNMAVTNESYDVGWYNKGPAPGDPGDAVMDGHVDWYDTSQAVFYSLKNVKVGDDVQVQRLDSTTHHFKVTSVKTVAYNADSKALGLFAPTGPPRLSLITCGGQWSRSINQYLSRVIVDAALVS